MWPARSLAAAAAGLARRVQRRLRAPALDTHRPRLAVPPPAAFCAQSVADSAAGHPNITSAARAPLRSARAPMRWTAHARPLPVEICRDAHYPLVRHLEGCTAVRLSAARGLYCIAIALYLRRGL